MKTVYIVICRPPGGEWQSLLDFNHGPMNVFASVDEADTAIYEASLESFWDFKIISGEVPE